MYKRQQSLLAYDELGVFVLQGGEDGAVVTAKELTFLNLVSTPAYKICKIEATGSAGDSPITNTCNFTLTGATTGTANLKFFVHFTNTSLPAGEQSLPLAILDRSFTIAINAPSQGETITIPYTKNNAYSYDNQTFTVMSSYNGSTNQVNITTSCLLYTSPSPRD